MSSPSKYGTMGRWHNWQIIRGEGSLRRPFLAGSSRIDDPAGLLIMAFSFVAPRRTSLSSTPSPTMNPRSTSLPISPSARRNANYWLAFFGKWTLCDVLVMCALIGMFNIQAEMDVLKLWDELKPDFVHLCDGICAGNGTSPLGGANCTELCEEAEAALSTTLLNDGTLPSSDLAFAVSMRGLTSMYLFCCAVVLSLSLGVAIEFLDDRQRAAAAAAAAAKGPKFMTTSEAERHISKLWRQEGDLLRIIFPHLSASAFFLHVLAVPPSRFRPPSKVGDDVFEHAQNVWLGKVLAANIRAACAERRDGAGEVIAVLDIDSDRPGAFTEADAEALQAILDATFAA